MHEYAITVEYWVQSEDEADEARRKLVEALAQHGSLEAANVSGWDIKTVEDVS